MDRPHIKVAKDAEEEELKLGYIEFVMAGVRHSAIVNPAGLLTIAEWMASA